MQTPDGPRTALGLLVVLALCLGVLAAVAPGTTYDVGYLSVLAGATAVAWWGGRRRSGTARVLALCVTGALAATSVGDLVWYVYYWTTGEPDVSWADPAYLLSYVFLGAALAYKHGEKLAIDTFVGYLPVDLQRKLYILIEILIP